MVSKSFLSAFLLLMPVSFAHCPLCVAATGGVVGSARLLGFSDASTGIAIGVFAVSTVLWLDKIIKKRYGKDIMPYQTLALTSVSVALTFLSFYVTDSFSIKAVLGIDSLSAGTIFGVLMSFAAFRISAELKKFNGSRNYVPFQPIIVLIFMLAASIAVANSAGV